MLRKNKLIDYSLVIFFVDRKKAHKNKDGQGGSFYYDPERRTFTNKSIKGSSTANRLTNIFKKAVFSTIEANRNPFNKFDDGFANF